MRINYFIVVGLFLFYTSNLFSQGDNCSNAQPMCSDLPITFPASTNKPSIDLNTAALRGCLGSAPNPAWYFLKIGNPGPINIYISQRDAGGTGRDVDFACWGPFPTDDWNSICTAQLGNSTGAQSHRPPNGNHDGNLGAYPRPAPSKMIDCSYFSDVSEWCYIPNAQRGEFYLLCLTNFSNRPANITFERLPITGSGTTDCSILPAAALGDTICYGSDVKIKIPRTKTTEKYNVILPTGGTYPAAKVSGTGAAITINIPATLVAGLRKGNHTFEVVTWEGTKSSPPVQVTVVVEELDNKILSYWGDPPTAGNKGSAICPGKNLVLGFNVPGANLPDSLPDEVPPRFYEKIGNTTSYIFLGTSNVVGSYYKFRRQVNANDFYAVDRETLYGKCKISKQNVRVIKGTTPKVDITIKDGVTPIGTSTPPPIPPYTAPAGEQGNTSNDDRTLPGTASVNSDGYWGNLSENPWVADRGISPIPNRGTLENDPVQYTVKGSRNGTADIKKTYFFGFPGSSSNNHQQTDDQETTMTGIVVDNDGCEGRKDTTILRLKPPKIRITLTNADTTVCGNDIVEIKARIVSVEDESYFPLTFKWQTIDPLTFNSINPQFNHPKLGLIGDGGNGNGNGSEEDLVTLADRNSIITFKVRVGTLFKVHAETRDLPTGIFNPDGTEQTNRFKSSSYFAKVNRLPLPKVTDLMSYERTITPGTPPQIDDKRYFYFCADSRVMIKAAGVRDYLWTVNTPDDPNPVVVGRTREVTTSEAVNRRPGERTVKLNMVGYNGCASDTSFKYEILPLPAITQVEKIYPPGADPNECLNQIKTLKVHVLSPNDGIIGSDPKYDETNYEAITDKNYEWKPLYNINPTSGYGSTVQVFPDTTQIYAVAYKDARGCLASWVDTVHAPVKVSGFSKQSQYCFGENIQLEIKMVGGSATGIFDAQEFTLLDQNNNRTTILKTDGVFTFAECQPYLGNFTNGGWNLKFLAKGVKGTCYGSDTVKIKIRPKPNFTIAVQGDGATQVTPPTTLPPPNPDRGSYSTDVPWKINGITKFTIAQLKFDYPIKDTTSQYAVRTTTDWDLKVTTPAANVTRTDFPEEVPENPNNKADTVQKITPKSDVDYTIKVTNEWYDLLVGDTLQCVSEPENVEIVEPAGIEITIPNPPPGGDVVDITTNRFGQRIWTVCRSTMDAGLPVGVIAAKSGIKSIDDVLWYKVKLENQKYIPTHGGYLPNFSTGTDPVGTLDNCAAGSWNTPSASASFSVLLPSSVPSSMQCPTRMPRHGEFGTEDNKSLRDSADIPYNPNWLNQSSTFALYVKATTTGDDPGYDVVYITVLPKLEAADFKIDAPLSAYKDLKNIYSFDPPTGAPPVPPLPPDVESNISQLDSTYNVWCYNQPYSITFTDRSLNYKWSSRIGVRQDLYDEFTYWLSPPKVNTYTITATDNYGCPSPSRKILVHPITSINITATLPESVCKNDSIDIRLDEGSNPIWRLNNQTLEGYHEDSLIVSYQKTKYGVSGSEVEIKTPTKIAIERTISPDYSYKPGTATSAPSYATITPPPPPPSYTTPNIIFAGCSDSLVLNIENWLNTPEIGAVLPEDTVLIKYNPTTKSYSLCLGSNPRFDVLNYREARRRGLRDGDKRLGKTIMGNTPANTFYEWSNYKLSNTSIDWNPESSWGHIRPLVPHAIDSLQLTVYNWNRVCKDSTILRIRADEVPKVNFSYAPKRINRKNKEVFFKYDTNPQYNYEWDLDIESDDDNSIIPDNSSGVKYYFTDGTTNKWIGRVVVAKDDGCRVEIPIKITRGLYIPNTFTPNDDQKNDKFLDPAGDLENLGLSVADFRVSVFTRRGQKVYEGSDGWDGTYNGNKMPSDVYYYVVEYTFDGEPMVHKGSVTLLR